MRGLVVGALLCAGCTSIGGGSGDDGDDAAPGDPAADGAPGAIDAAAGDALGSPNNPAASCAELRDAGADSGVYWIKHPNVEDSVLQLYCEQELGGGGWAMLYNSVNKPEGETTAFFQIAYVDRFEKMGVADPADNYYDGALYLLGTEYLDVITDLADTTAVAARVDAQGFYEDTMAFQQPELVAGNQSLYDSQFAAGWSSFDHDGDTAVDVNCASNYCNVTQHYSSCWGYNLGCDAGGGGNTDGGPHVNDNHITALNLALEPSSGGYSLVKRIARFTRW